MASSSSRSFFTSTKDAVTESHAGIVKMKSLARSYVWWPGIHEQLDQLTMYYEECSRIRSEPAAVKEAAWPTPINPWHRIHIDYAEVVGKVFFVIVDTTSKWPEIFLMKTSTAAATIDVLREVFSRFGHPFKIVSDNGLQFTSAEFQSFLSKNGIRHQMGAPFNPKTNVLTEWMVRSAKEAMEEMKNQPGSFYVKLQRFLLSYRNTPHAKTVERLGNLHFPE